MGLFAALSLARRGIAVTIADRDWRTGAHSYALALHGQTLALLEDCGLKEQVLEGALPVASVGLYDDRARRACVPLESSPAAVLRQDVLEGLLERALERAGVSVLWNHEVSLLREDRGLVTARIDRLEKESMGYASARTEWVVARSWDLEVPWVIGADGHRSTVRQSLGIDFPTVGWASQFAVFEFAAPGVDPELRIVLGRDGTGALWPMPGGHCRWSFEVPPAVPAEVREKHRLAVQLGQESFSLLDEDSLRDLVRRRAPWFTAEIGELCWRILVQFERRLAASFGKGRMWLAGDAAHVTGPVGMQSMNVGLGEAAALADALTGILCEGRSADVLEEYNRHGQAQWRTLLGAAGPEPAAAADPWLRQHARRILESIPASGAVLESAMRTLGL